MRGSDDARWRKAGASERAGGESRPNRSVLVRPTCSAGAGLRDTFTGESRAAEAPMKFTRITSDPRQMGGMPCIRGLRIPVATVVGMIADGMTENEILSAYPDLEGDDEALRLSDRGAPAPSGHWNRLRPSGSHFRRVWRAIKHEADTEKRYIKVSNVHTGAPWPNLFYIY